MSSRCSTRVARRGALALLMVLALTPGVNGQDVVPDRSDWTRLVDLYLSGQREEAIASLLRAPHDRLRRNAARAIDDWRDTGRSNAGAAAERQGAIRRLQASALLPLELLLEIEGPTVRSDGLAMLETIARIAWERLASFESATAVRTDPHDGQQVRTFRRWWRIAVLQYFASTGRYAEYAREVAVFGASSDDADAAADFHFLRGLRAETIARLAGESSIGSSSRIEAPIPRLVGARANLGDAGREYRRALELSPSHAEARLRLARVHLESGRRDEAMQSLAPLLSEPCRDTVCALAFLFLGELHDLADDLPAAAAAYVRASSVTDVRQTALLALMQLAARRGEDASAFGLTARFTVGDGTVPRDGPDAWGRYLVGRRIDSLAVRSRLREALLP